MINKITIKLFVNLLIYSVLSCTNLSETKDSSIIDEAITISNFEFTDNSLLDSVFSNKCDIICLETDDNSFMKKIDRIYKIDDYILTLDKHLKKICIFDSKGKFINFIKNIGNGPQEYISLMDFCLDIKEKKIVLLCDKPYKIMWYDFNGHFLDERNISDFFRNIIMDSTSIYCNRSDLNKTASDNYEISSFESNKNTINNFLKTRDNITNTLFTDGNYLTKNNFINYTRRFDNSIYQIGDNMLLRKYILDFSKYNLPYNLLEEKDMSKFSKLCRDKKYVYSITDVVENENFILFNTNCFIGLFDKINKTFRGYKNIKNTQLEIGTNSFLSCGDNKFIVTLLNPDILYKLKGELQKKYISYFGNIKADDNPILMFYKIK